MNKTVINQVSIAAPQQRKEPSNHYPYHWAIRAGDRHAAIWGVLNKMTAHAIRRVPIYPYPFYVGAASHG